MIKWPSVLLKQLRFGLENPKWNQGRKAEKGMSRYYSNNIVREEAVAQVTILFLSFFSPIFVLSLYVIVVVHFPIMHFTASGYPLDSTTNEI